MWLLFSGALAVLVVAALILAARSQSLRTE